MTAKSQAAVEAAVDNKINISNPPSVVTSAADTHRGGQYSQREWEWEWEWGQELDRRGRTCRGGSGRIFRGHRVLEGDHPERS